MSYGLGTGLNDNPSGTALYSVYSANNTPETFDSAGSVRSIKIYNNTTNGWLRIWKGTFSGTTFSFDSYTEAVSITGLSTGWITLTSPTDFTAFDVTTSTALVFQSNTDNAIGLTIGGTDTAPEFAGYSSGATPPYSSSIAMSQSTARRLEIYIEGYAT